MQQHLGPFELLPLSGITFLHQYQKRRQTCADYQQLTSVKEGELVA